MVWGAFLSGVVNGGQTFKTKIHTSHREIPSSHRETVFQLIAYLKTKT